MKTTLLIITLIVSSNLFSQKVGYFYDDAGNRVQRMLCPTCRLAAPDTTTENSRNLSAAILPNPTKGRLAIEVTEEPLVSGEEESHFHVVVHDVYGREVINEYHNTTNFNIDISGNPPGVYFVKLTTDKRVKRWEIVME